MYLSAAVQTIKSHCLRQDDCINCVFARHDSDGVSCSLCHNPPIRWDSLNSNQNTNNRNNVDDAISWLMTEFEITKEQATTIYHLLHITINSFKES